MSKIECPNPECLSNGGINKNQPKSGWNSLGECIREGQIIAERQERQGAPFIINTAYMCTAGTWHHSSRPGREIRIIGGFHICCGRGTAPARIERAIAELIEELRNR